jgi:hypothetical protein
MMSNLGETMDQAPVNKKMAGLPEGRLAGWKTAGKGVTGGNG